MTFPWRTALLVSAAVNLIAIAAFAGAYASGARLERPAPPEPPPAEDVQVDLGGRFAGQRAFMAALPPEARMDLRRALAGQAVAMRQEREAMRAARQELLAAAGADPYDAARVRAAFARVRAANEAGAARFQGALAEAFGRLSVEERRAALAALDRAQPMRAGAPAALDGQMRPQLTPEQRLERRQRLREKLRERRQQRMQQQ